MKNVLIIGAGRSATALINYLLDLASQNQIFVTIADADPAVAQAKVNGRPNSRATWLDVTKPNDRKDTIERHDVVVSLLPAHLHLRVAKDCIKYKKHLVTASYVSRELYRLGEEVKKSELIFMGEMGLDPGIDHMSTMRVIDELKEKGAKITSYMSYAGGLIAPESDDNPWNYKFTWNPRNVVLAGRGTAQYMKNGKYKYIPYHRLFKEYEIVNVEGHGEFEAYVNRSSLLYRNIYGLENIPNIKRATLRKKGFCDAWEALVRIGLTEESYPIEGSKDMTYFDLMDAYLGPQVEGSTLKERVSNLLGEALNSVVMQKLEWLGLFDRKKIGLGESTPAKILQHLLEQKWQLKPSDKDMIVMQHELDYTHNNKQYRRTSTMVMKGNSAKDTAMAKLVGLPIGIIVKLIIEGKIKSTGVHIPVSKEVYHPVLNELETFGVKFLDKDVELPEG